MKSIILVILTLITSICFSATEITIEGKSSSEFILAGEYGYRSQSWICRSLNPWNPSGKKYKEDIVKAQEIADGHYALILRPENQRDPGICDWSLVSLNLLVMPKKLISGKKINNAKLVIRSFLTSDSLPEEPKHFSEFKELECTIKKYAEPVGNENYTHYVSCDASDGSVVEFSQTTMNPDLSQTFTLDL